MIASTRNPRPDQEGIASEKLIQRRQLQQPEAVLDKSNISTRVHFKAAPNEVFYLTKSLLLVQVTRQGIKVLANWPVPTILITLITLKANISTAPYFRYRNCSK